MCPTTPAPIPTCAGVACKGRLETLVKFKREKEKSQKSNLIRGWLTEKEMIKLGWDESRGLHWYGRFLSYV